VKVVHFPLAGYCSRI